MRILGFLITCLTFMSVSAHAQTYLLTYTGKPLKVTKGDDPLPGATNIVLTYQFPAAYLPGPGGCANYNSAQGFAPSSYSDGANTLASLQAAGYGLSSVIYFCLDSTGKKIVSWRVGMSGATGDRNPYNYFQVQSAYNYMTYQNYKDAVELYIDVPGGIYYGDSAPAGKWKIKRIKSVP